MSISDDSDSSNSDKKKKKNKKDKDKNKKKSKKYDDLDISSEDEDKEKTKTVTDENLIKLVKDKILEKMSIEDLKGLCSGKGINTKGMKRQDMLNILKSNQCQC